MKILFAGLMTFMCGVYSGFAVVSDEDQGIYDWYDTLGYPETAGLRWAEVRDITLSQQLMDKKKSYKGFILKDEKDKITLLMPSLRLLVFHRTWMAEGETFRAEWEPSDLALDVSARLEKLKHPKDGDYWEFHSDPLSPAAQLVVLARALHARGEHSLAGETLDQVRQQTLEKLRDKSFREGRSFRQGLRMGAMENRSYDLASKARRKGGSFAF